MRSAKNNTRTNFGSSHEAVFNNESHIDIDIDMIKKIQLPTIIGIIHTG